MSERVVHGVNLLGWLSLEPWISPELFSAVGALDEDELVAALDHDEYVDLVRKHRASFITQTDLRQIAARGFNAVRLVVPWYAYGSDGPNPGPFLGCIELIDECFEWAADAGLDVLLTLGISLGCHKNARTARSCCDADELSPVFSSDLSHMRDARERALDVTCALAKRYATADNFFGFEVADAPFVQRRRGLSLSDGIPAHVMRNYYRDAYKIIREVVGPEPVIVFPDGGRSSGWTHFVERLHDSQVWLDMHTDRILQDHTEDISGPAGIVDLVEVYRNHLKKLQKHDLSAMVGSWSSALPLADSAMTPEGRIALERVYTAEQLRIFQESSGWFFSTWKTSTRLHAWDARIALASFERRRMRDKSFPEIDDYAD